jgi:hypothetical protein
MYAMPPTTTSNPGFQAFLCKVIVAIVDPLIVLISAAAFAYFLYGVAKFILDRSRGEEADAGKSHMLWGIVGLAIIFGAYGIINVSLGTTGLGSYSRPQCSQH